MVDRLILYGRGMRANVRIIGLSAIVALVCIGAAACGDSDESQGEPRPAPNAIRYRLVSGSEITTDMSPAGESLTGFFDVTPGAMGIPDIFFNYEFDRIRWHSGHYKIEGVTGGWLQGDRFGAMRFCADLIINGDEQMGACGRTPLVDSERPSSKIEGLEITRGGLGLGEYRIVIFATREDPD